MFPSKPKLLSLPFTSLHHLAQSSPSSSVLLPQLCASSCHTEPLALPRSSHFLSLTSGLCPCCSLCLSCHLPHSTLCLGNSYSSFNPGFI